MDKNHERACLNAVFGPVNLSVSECEEPDFVCGLANEFQFGVEVTEFFRTESDARLTRLEQYSTELLSGGNYRHKDDLKEIRVESGTWQCGETGKRRKVKVIARSIPSHDIAIPLLLQRIARKNQKFPRYSSQVAPVDLIVDDVNRVLRFEEIEELLLLFLDCDEVRLSPFREIYLLTSNKHRGIVAIPLKANVFASEIVSFGAVYNQYRRDHGGPNLLGEFLDALAIYLAERLPQVQYDSVDDLPRYIFGSTGWRLTREQKSEFMDMSIDDMRGAKKIALETEGRRLPDVLNHMLSNFRITGCASCDLFFPIHGEKELTGLPSVIT
jgi:hypothetical protein